MIWIFLQYLWILLVCCVKNVESLSPQAPSAFSFARPPHLALVTERCTCDSEARLKESIAALRRACCGSKAVDLVSVRIDPEAPRERVVRLTKALIEIRDDTHFFRVVLNSDWKDLVAESGADGVHFKEAHRHLIASVRQLHPNLLVGASAHSVESALEVHSEYHPDYFFVGTCYMTDSHPEKAEADLEGPLLPGEVTQALQTETISPPPVFAIGGIDLLNCHVPVCYGANGTATIRAVLHSFDPGIVASQMKENMLLASISE